MKISTKGRYALRMLIDLGMHKDDGYITLKEIADRQDISKKYLEQIVPLLNRGGILQANRGFQGGYRMAKEPKEYTAGDILRLTEGDLAPVTCLVENAEECPRYEACSTVSLWKGLKKVINEYLDGITLQDLLDRAKGGCPTEYII